jgi:Platelet-activating factor acetylhydrolase, isoform II
MRKRRFPSCGGCLVYFWYHLLRIALVLLGISLLGLLVLSLWLSARRSRPVSLPSVSGSYAIGRLEYTWEDPNRLETLAPDQGSSSQNRKLFIWIWYPALPVAGASPAPYLPAAWSKAVDEDRSLWKNLYQSTSKIHVHAVENAPLQGKSPLLIFTAGYGQLPPSYTTLIEDLASHGYIVAGVVNPYSSPVVVYPNGQVIRRSPAGTIPETAPDGGQAAADRLVDVWADDIHSTIDILEKLNVNPASRIDGHLDMSQIGVFGHSFGGAASAEACLVDVRCKAVIDIDGTLYGAAAKQGTIPPFLIIRSQPFSEALEKTVNESFAASRSRGALTITIQGTRHFSFTDMAVTFAPALRLVGILGSINGERGLAITSYYVRTFFDRYLLDVPSPSLDKPVPEYPEVIINR